MVSTIIVIIIKYADETDIRCFKFTTKLEPNPRSLLDLCRIILIKVFQNAIARV